LIIKGTDAVRTRRCFCGRKAITIQLRKGMYQVLYLNTYGTHPKGENVKNTRYVIAVLTFAVIISGIMLVAFADGVIVSGSEAVVDMTTVTAAELPAKIEWLKTLEKVDRIRLTPSDGRNLLSVDDVMLIHEALPEAALDYSFEFFGKTVNLADTGELEYKKVNIGNEGAELFKKVLPMMKRCTRLVIDLCGIDDEVMADLRNSVDNVKVVWHVVMGSHGCMTDARRFRADPDVMKAAADFEKLKYCTELEFIDLGHNGSLTNVDFVSYMPNLKAIIIVNSKVSSLEPFRSCKELQMLEMVDVHNVTDLTPLLDCPKLRLLNISNSRGITDVSCMMGKESLERFYLPLNYVKDEEQLEALVESLPDCIVTVERHGDCGGMTENYGHGWRHDVCRANGGCDYTDWYAELRQVFFGEKKNFYNYNSNVGKEPAMPELEYFK